MILTMKEYKSLSRTCSQIREALATTTPGTWMNRVLTKRLIILEDQLHRLGGDLVATLSMATMH